MDLLLSINDDVVVQDLIVFEDFLIRSQNTLIANFKGRCEMHSFGEKQSWEEYYVSFNFVRLVDKSTTIQSVIVIVFDEDNNIVTDTLIDAEKTLISGTRILIFVRGGSNQVYKITCRITCENGECFEEDGELPVIEK